jgi:gas vesicle protein
MENNDRDEGSDVSTRLTYLLIGGGIGAILALLFAPKSGTELRGDIADVTRKGIDKSREGARYVGDKAGEYYGTVREKATDWVGAARDTATQKRGQFSAAIEAGKQAYTRRRGRLSFPALPKPSRLIRRKETLVNFQF